jgi:hypothetical protein
LLRLIHAERIWAMFMLKKRQAILGNMPFVASPATAPLSFPILYAHGVLAQTVVETAAVRRLSWEWTRSNNQNQK